MPRSSKPRRKAAPAPAPGGGTRRTGPRKTDLRYGAPGQDLRPRSARYGDGRPPRLPGRSGGR